MSNTIKIYLADDHHIVAKGIASIIEKIPNTEVLHIFSNGKDLFEACNQQLPSLVFLDLDMPIWNGLKTLTELKINYPQLRCLMLSMNNEKAIIEECIQKGASGYLNKDCTEAELQEAIFTEEPIFLSKEVLRSLSGYSKKTESTGFKLQTALTDRELDILALLCEGLSPKEIAEKIYLSPRTVETHKKNIMEKFDINSIGKLISVALKNNFIK